MPKALREKARLHARAAGHDAHPARAQSSVTAEVKAAVKELIESNSLAARSVAQFTAQLLAGISDVSQTSPSQPSPAPSLPATSPPLSAPVAKQLTKAAKREAKHSRLMSKLMIPGSIRHKHQPSKPLPSPSPLTSLSSLSSLIDTLPMASEPSATQSQSQSLLKSNKSRSRLRAAELDQFTAVLAHPSYTANPMAAMQQHLLSLQQQQLDSQKQAQHFAKQELRQEEQRKQERADSASHHPLSKSSRRRAAKRAKAMDTLMR